MIQQIRVDTNDVEALRALLQDAIDLLRNPSFSKANQRIDTEKCLQIAIGRLNNLESYEKEVDQKTLEEEVNDRKRNDALKLLCGYAQSDRDFFAQGSEALVRKTKNVIDELYKQMPVSK